MDHGTSFSMPLAKYRVNVPCKIKIPLVLLCVTNKDKRDVYEEHRVTTAHLDLYPQVCIFYFVQGMGNKGFACFGVSFLEEYMVGGTTLGHLLSED